MEHRFFDPVVEEVRERGQAYAKRFGNDIHAIMEDLRQHQRQNPELYKSNKIDVSLLQKTNAQY